MKTLKVARVEFYASTGQAVVCVSDGSELYKITGWTEAIERLGLKGLIQGECETFTIS